MSEQTIKTNEAPLADMARRNLGRTEREQLRDRLNADMAQWLADGNVIDDRGPANDDYNHRPARAVTPGHFV